MDNALIIGFASMFAVVAVVVKIALLVYFFVLLNRLIGAVERIELRGKGIESALRTPPGTSGMPETPGT